MCGKIAWLAVNPGCRARPGLQCDLPHAPSDGQRWLGLSYSSFPSPPFHFGTSSDSPDSPCTCTQLWLVFPSPSLLHQANSLAIKPLILECKTPALNTSLMVVKGQVWAPSMPAVSPLLLQPCKHWQVPVPTRMAQWRITPQTCGGWWVTIPTRRAPTTR